MPVLPLRTVFGAPPRRLLPLVTSALALASGPLEGQTAPRRLWSAFVHAPAAASVPTQARSPSSGMPGPTVGAAAVDTRRATVAGAGETGRPGRPAASPDPSRVALYSALVPGAGQLVMGQRRGFGYLALEGLAWYLHADRRAEGHDLRDAYRALAWETARNMRGPAVVDDFEYYERLSVWPASGAWDSDPASGGLQPETDPATFNGSVWKRASELFLGPDPGSADPADPRFASALAYYEERAYPPALLWDWNGSENARERFLGLIEESDEQLREATTMIGVILANHVLSAADAFVSARLRDATDGRVDGGLALTFPRPGGGVPTGRALGPSAGSLTLHLEVRP